MYKASGRAVLPGPAGREGGCQCDLAMLKLIPLPRWVKVARPAPGDDVVHPAIGFPAPARKLVKSADAVPQSMLGLETLYPPAGRYAEPARSLCRTVKPMPPPTRVAGRVASRHLRPVTCGHPAAPRRLLRLGLPVRVVNSEAP